jgi:hypothetical protein
MKRDVSKTLAVAHLELLRRAYTHSDLEAWARFQESLEKTVRTWFHRHSDFESVSRVQSDKHFIDLAFERLWQAIVQRQIACVTFSEVLVYLRASLNGAILETLRTCSRPSIASAFGSADQNLQYATHGLEVWSWVQTQLFNEREQRLAYLLYHCGLPPAEIVRSCPQEWSDVHEVTRMRLNIFAKLKERPEW